MDKLIFQKFIIGDLEPGDWIRTALGDVGVIHDKVDQGFYRRVCVEIPGARNPIRIIDFDVEVEKITDRKIQKS